MRPGGGYKGQILEIAWIEQRMLQCDKRGATRTHCDRAAAGPQGCWSVKARLRQECSCFGQKRGGSRDCTTSARTIMICAPVAQATLHNGVVVCAPRQQCA
eukprot:730366-Amphidinium_carterae.2